MKIVIYTPIISPHILPLVHALRRDAAGAEVFYIYTEPLPCDAKQRGWEWNQEKEWLIDSAKHPNLANDLLQMSDLLLSGIRDVELFSSRERNNLSTLYMGERWFKPRLGMLRLLSPRYFKMAWRFVGLLRYGQKICCFPIGIYAAKDMARLCGLFAGDLRCLFRAPSLNYEKKPGGRIWVEDSKDNSLYCLDKMRIWGYFVDKASQTVLRKDRNESVLRVLCVGRLLDWKRVDTIIRAVREHSRSSSASNDNHQLQLDIYGTGPEETRLKALAKCDKSITIHPPVPIAEVRRLMREHDVYVLSSNGFEGWGAVVSEALEEGMSVIGTYEAGSSATMLPESNLYHSGDYVALSRLLQSELKRFGIGVWDVNKASKVLLQITKGL